jgi:hypothetical protein
VLLDTDLWTGAKDEGGLCNLGLCVAGVVALGSNSCGFLYISGSQEAR